MSHATKRQRAANSSEEIATPTSKHNDVLSSASITQQQAKEYVERILKWDEEDMALALIALIHGIAYDREFWHRDGIALAAIDHAVTLAPSFSAHVVSYVERATTHQFESPVSKIV